jgi:hypothetical protein
MRVNKLQLELPGRAVASCLTTLEARIFEPTTQGYETTFIEARSAIRIAYTCFLLLAGLYPATTTQWPEYR